MEVINCKLFIIPKFMKKHIYLLLFLLGALFRVLVPDLFYFFNKKRPDPDLKCQQSNQTENTNCRCKFLLTRRYIEIINNVLSALLLGIPHFLNRMRNKNEEYKNRKKQTYITNNQKINLFYYNNESSRIPLMLKIIFIISSVDIFCQLTIPIKYLIDKKLYNKIWSQNQYNLYSFLFFDIFARYFFSRWILKTYFYFHHKISFLLNGIGLTLIAVPEILVKIGDEPEQYNKYNYLFLIVIAVQLIVYSFEDIMNKVAFRALSILPYTLIFYNGLIQLCYFAIISAFFFIFNLGDLRKYANFTEEIQYSICYLPFNIIRNYYLIKVIDTFSAQHMALLRVTETSLIFVYNLIATINPKFKKKAFKEDSYFIILESIGFLFLIVSSLIHNEIIIINHRKLKAKTQFYLDKDADKEQNVSINSDTCFSDSGTNSVTNLYDDLTGSDIS